AGTVGYRRAAARGLTTRLAGMSRSIAEVQRDLRELLRDPAPFDVAMQEPRASRPARRSSVLILFGALDRTLAQRAGAGAGSGAVREPADAAVPAVPVELDILLTRRADGMRHHPGQIAFPGGGAEPGDAGPAHPALREAHEETGLDPAGVEVLGELPEVLIPVSNNLVTPVLGWWRLPSEVAADHSESVDVFRTPVAELLD